MQILSQQFSSLIACLLPIRDDGDIVYKHLTYYYNLGCENFYILNHCGTEEDKKEIQRFRSDAKCNITLIEDDDPVYNQDSHYQLLSDKAKKHKWHILSDTDELLILKKNKKLPDYFQYKDCDMIIFKWYDYKDVTGNSIFEWSHRGKNDRGLGKCAIRYHSDLRWSWGHHAATWTKDTKHAIPANVPKTGVLYENSNIAFYGHFIFRNFEKWKQRRIDFADAKYKRFGNDSFWKWHSGYDEIKNDFNYLTKQGRWKSKLQKRYSCDLVYDPIDKDLFVLK